MPVLRLIRERFEREKPLAGIRIGACLHVTTETANLCRTLKAGGADVVPLRLQPALHPGRRGRRAGRRLRHPRLRHQGRGRRDLLHATSTRASTTSPSITMDDGADLVGVLHGERADLIADVIGGTEETTTGVIRLRAMEAEGVLKFPIVAVNDADTKHLFDNRYGTGQSTIDGIIRATNILLAGSNVVRRRLRLVRPGRRHAGAGARRRRHRHRGRPACGARGGHGRLPGHADGRGRQDRRHLRHRHRRHPRRCAASTSRS